MGNLEQFNGRVSLLSGFGAVLIMAVWSWFHFHGFDFSFLPFIGYLTALLLFQYATPVLCFSALFFGFPARRQLTAKIGLGLALIALVSYARHIIMTFMYTAE